ncbi:TPA: hypothetical protein RED94_000043 [Listeria monocytogenes]|nr:hypothetical protein [Listeria monocytogenes]
MSSELVKKLELAKLEYEDDLVKVAAEDFCEGFMEGIQAATNVVREHEAQQMKEPFYQLDQKQTNLLADMKTTFRDGEDLVNIFEMVFEEYEDKLSTLKLNQVFNAFTTWAIEQEKKKEEENGSNS